MTALTWNNVGERFFETGVDQGVLYVGTADGVAWNGLVSVEENPQGAELRSYYIDGINYQNEVSPEEFRGTIKAFYSPREFDPCEGLGTVAVGLYQAKQRRVPFGLSYRTKVGNDVDGQEHGYKIHIIYDALVGATDRAYSSIDDDPEALLFDWKFLAQDHYIVNTTTMSPTTVAAIEDVLYGTPSLAPRLPTRAELETLAIPPPPDLTITTPGDGTFIASGDPGIVDLPTIDTFTMTDPDVVFIDANTYTATSP